MELYEIKNWLDKAHLLIDEYRKSAQIDEKLREIEGLSYQTMQDGFWDDPTKAKKIYDELNDMKKITDEYENLCQSLNSLDETYTLVKETDDQEFQTILESDYQDFEQRMSEFEKILLLSGSMIVLMHRRNSSRCRRYRKQDWQKCCIVCTKILFIERF